MPTIQPWAFIVKTKITGGVVRKFHHKNHLSAGLQPNNRPEALFKIGEYTSIKLFKPSTILIRDKIKTFIGFRASIFPYVYVVDSNNHRIQAFTYDGDFVFEFGKYGSGAGEFKYPYGIANDGTYLYVTDSGNNRVQVFDLKGNYIYEFGNGFLSNPKGIVIYNNYLIAVANYDSDNISLFIKENAVFYEFLVSAGNHFLKKPLDLSLFENGIVVSDATGVYHISLPKRFPVNLKATLSKGITSNLDLYCNSDTIDGNLHKIEGSLKLKTNVALGLNLKLPSVYAKFSSGNSLETTIKLKLNSIINVNVGNRLTIYGRIQNTFDFEAKSLTSLGADLLLNTNRLVFSSKLLSSNVKSLALGMRQPNGRFRLNLGHTGNLSLRTPSIRFNTNLSPFEPASLNITLNRINSRFILADNLQVFDKTIAINKYNLAITEYNFIKNNIASVFYNGSIISNNDGTFKLESNSNLTGYIQTKTLDIRSNSIAIPIELFISGDTTTAVKYLIDNNSIDLESNRYSDFLETRVKLPKGIKSRYASFGIYIKRGTIDNISVIGYNINKRRR